MRRFFLAVFSFLQATTVKTHNVGFLEPRDAGNICTIIGQASAIVGGQLFFARGSYSFEGGDTLTRQMSLYSLDLSNTFQADAYISSSEYKSIPLPDGVPYIDDAQTFFYDNTTLYFYVPNNTTADKIWAYNASTESFQDLSVARSSNNPLVDSSGGWASNPATGQSYFTGSPSGGLAKRSPSSPWLQVLDSSTSDVQWLAGAGGGPVLSNSAMVYVRYGKAGILVAFGGVNPNDHTQFASTSLGAYRPMTDIFIFDIYSSTWYNITASGANGASDIPEARISFCAGVSSAPDDSSFQINIYGGYNLHNAAAMNSVYVLTLPSFQWINVTSYGHSSSDARFNVGRQSHQCLMWQDTEMIVLGGIIESTITNDVGQVNRIGCNSSHPPLLVLDTTTFEWQQQFSPNRTYSVPVPVYNVIGGDYRGSHPGAPVASSPLGGFNNSNLDAIFSQTVPRIDAPTSFPSPVSSTSSTGSTTTTVTPIASSSASTGANSTGASSTNVNAIGGSVIAGVIILVGASIAGITLILRRRERQANQHTSTSEHFYLGGHKPELDGVPTAFPSEMDVGHSTNAAFQELPEDGLYEAPETPRDCIRYELPGDFCGLEMASVAHSPKC